MVGRAAALTGSPATAAADPAPSPNARGAPERADGQWGVHGWRRPAAKSGGSALGYLPSCELRRARTDLGKQPPVPNRIRPAVKRDPTHGRPIADFLEGADPPADLHRRCPLDPEQSQRQRNRRGRVASPRQDGLRHHENDGGAHQAAESPTRYRQLRRIALGVRRTQHPSRPEPVTVQSQFGSRRPARHAASRAPFRPNVVGGGHLGQPSLDVQLTLYDSLRAPVSVRDSTGATMGTVVDTPVPITFFEAKTIQAPPPPSVRGAHYITPDDRLQPHYPMVAPSPSMRAAISKKVRRPCHHQHSTRAVTLPRGPGAGGNVRKTV